MAMGANLPRAEDALDASTMARPKQAKHPGRAFSFVRRAARRRLDSIFLMATAQFYTQGKLAPGRPIAHTPVTWK
jgi:hypothetical protein